MNNKTDSNELDVDVQSELGSTIAGGSQFMISSIIQFGIQVIVTLLLSIMLNVNDFGTFAIIYSFAFIITRIADFGISESK